jgi:hypothetical protein
MAFEGAFVEKKTDWKGKLKEYFAELDINLGLKLFKFEIFEGMNIGARYRYGVERSYNEGYHARIDKWRISTGLNPGDLIEDNLPIYMNMHKGTDIYFVRQFKSKKKALKAIPYTPLKLPVTAKRAIEKLNPGDFVSIPSRMTFVVGATASSSSGGDASGSVKASVYYLIHGDFIVNVFRMKDNKVQLRLIAQNGRDVGGRVKVGYEFKAIEISVLGSEIDKVIDLDLARLGYSQGKGNQFVLDYIYDLNNADAAAAYNKILSSTYKFKELSIIKSYLKKRKISDAIVGTYLPSEKLFKEDRDRRNKRVTRLFKGFNNFKTKKTNFEFNIQLAKFENNRTLSKNHLAEENADGTKDHYLFHNYAVSDKRSYGFWPLRFKERSYTNFFSLIPTDAELNSSDTHPDVGYMLEMRDKHYRGGEYEKFLQLLGKNLPKSVLDRIEWRGWNEEKKREDALIYAQFVINRHAFQNLRRFDFDVFHSKLKAFYHEKKDLMDDFLGQDVESWDPTAWIVDAAYIKKTAKRLHSFLYDTKMTGAQKVENMMALRNNKVFKKLGFGFMLQLLSDREIERNVYIKLDLQAHKEDAVLFEYGTEDSKDFYEYLQYVTWAINGRSYDRRIVHRTPPAKPQ